METSYTFNTIDNPHKELIEVERTVKSNICWAVNNKDKQTLYSTIARSNELFFFQPDSKSTIIGITEFNALIEVFMKEDFRAIRAELKDLRINISSFYHR